MGATEEAKTMHCFSK